MNHPEKGLFCQVLATLFYSPDHELTQQISQGSLHAFFLKYIQAWEGGEGLIRGFLIEKESDMILKDLEEAYGLLFIGVGKGSVSLVESVYKPWTQDSHCPLPFASEKGFMMGDPALHLLEIYHHCNMEIAEEFRTCPDHIGMELEFLSYLYRGATDVEIKKFMEDHLDWIPHLKEELKRLQPHPFYMSAVEVLDFFLNREMERLEVESRGKKDIA